jgi:hypothetical protein
MDPETERRLAAVPAVLHGWKEPPDAPPPGHDGFTFELNLGLGITRFSPDGHAAATNENGLGGLDVGIGGFINRQNALMLRISGTQFGAGTDANGDAIQFLSGFVGPSLQHWIGEDVFVGGGMGIAVLSLVSGTTTRASDRGFGLDGRVGYAFSHSASNAFHGSLEISTGLYDGGAVTSFAVLVGWQHI